MNAIEQILAVSDAMLDATDLDEKRLSGRVFNDRNKLPALRNGSDLYTTRHQAAMQWFSDNWPDNALWPDNVERPSVCVSPSADGSGEKSSTRGRAESVSLTEGSLPSTEKPHVERSDAQGFERQRGADGQSPCEEAAQQ